MTCHAAIRREPALVRICAWCVRDGLVADVAGASHTICSPHRRADFLAPIVHGVIARMQSVDWYLSEDTRREMAADLERVARALAFEISRVPRA